MRPPVAEFVPSCPRKLSAEQQQQSTRPSAAAAAAGPSTFFLTRYSNDDDYQDHDPSPCSTSDEPAINNSMYGVQSLHDTLQQSSLTEDDLWSSSSSTDHNKAPGSPRAVVDDDDDDDDDDGNDKTSQRPLSRLLDRLESIRRDGSASSFSLRRPLSDPAASPRSLTPFNLDDPSSSFPNSPKSLSSQSLRQLDDISIPDDESVPREEDNLPAPVPTTTPSTSESSSQLVMPSIKMPSRRPFTDKGKAMGRFKVLIAGSSGECIDCNVVLACK